MRNFKKSDFIDGSCDGAWADYLDKVTPEDSIDALELNRRPYNALRHNILTQRSKINKDYVREITVGDLLKLDMGDFENFRYLGKKSLREVLNKLHRVETNLAKQKPAQSCNCEDLEEQFTELLACVQTIEHTLKRALCIIGNSKDLKSPQQELFQ